MCGSEEKRENGSKSRKGCSFIFKYFSFSSINILGELVVQWLRTVKDNAILKIVLESGVGKNSSSKARFWLTSPPFPKSTLSLMKKKYKTHFHPSYFQQRCQILHTGFPSAFHWTRCRLSSRRRPSTEGEGITVID